MPQKPSSRPEGGGGELPPGTYGFFVLKAEDKETKNHQPMIVVECQVVSPPEFSKRHHWVNMVNADTNPFAYDTYMGLCVACGYKDWQVNPKALVGKRFSGEVSYRPGKKKDDKPFCDTKNIQPFAHPTVAEPAGDDGDSDQSVPF